MRRSVRNSVCDVSDENYKIVRYDCYELSSRSDKTEISGNFGYTGIVN